MTAQGNSPVEGGHSDPGSAEHTPVASSHSPAEGSTDTGYADAAVSKWGRVEPDGTVYVRTADGEHFAARAVEGDHRAVVHGLQELATPDLGDQFVRHSSLHRCSVDCRQLTSWPTSRARRRS